MRHIRNRIGLALAMSTSIAVGTPTVAQIAAANKVLNAGQAATVKPKGGGFLSGIFGCSASGSKQVIGAAGGGAVGGLLGNRIAGKGSRAIGTIAGAAVGAAAGSAIGCKLQRNDQAKAERAVEQAAASNQKQTWSNPETGASGEVEPVNIGAQAGLADLKLASQVEPVDNYQRINGNYVATVNANLRSSPALTGEILGQVHQGQKVWVPASTSNNGWMLISEQGVGQGYVSSALLKPSVSPRAGCRVVKQTISTPGHGTDTETLEACRQSDGQWALTRV